LILAGRREGGICLDLLLCNSGALRLRVVFGRALDGNPLNLMQAFQKALDGFWRDITGRERLEVFEDPGIPIFELAVRLFAAILPPVLRQFREAGFFEATIWKIPEPLFFPGTAYLM
jgi:hypothetical protein